jgi:hypothetical protein
MHLTSKQKRRERREERLRIYISEYKKREAVIPESIAVKKCNFWNIFQLLVRK